MEYFQTVCLLKTSLQIKVMVVTLAIHGAPWLNAMADGALHL